MKILLFNFQIKNDESKIFKRSLKELCNDIDLIIEGKGTSSEHTFIGVNLSVASTKELSHEDIDLVCATSLKIAKTKNRTLRYLEKIFWDFFIKIPFILIVMNQIVIDEDEESLFI